MYFPLACKVFIIIVYCFVKLKIRKFVWDIEMRKHSFLLSKVAIKHFLLHYYGSRTPNEKFAIQRQVYTTFNLHYYGVLTPYNRFAQILTCAISTCLTLWQYLMEFKKCIAKASLKLRFPNEYTVYIWYLVLMCAYNDIFLRT